MLRRVTSIVSALLAVFVFSSPLYAGGVICKEYGNNNAFSMSSKMAYFSSIYSEVIIDSRFAPYGVCQWHGYGKNSAGSYVSIGVEGYQSGTCPDFQAVIDVSGTCGAPSCPAGVNSDGSCKPPRTAAQVSAAVRDLLKGQGFSNAAAIAAETAAIAAYNSCSASSSSTCETVANDAAYLAAVNLEKDSATGSIMSKAVLGGIAAAGVVAALPAFLAVGTIGAASALAVSIVASAGLAIESYQPTADGSYKQPVSSAAVPLNVRLSSSSPSLSGVPEAAYSQATNTFTPSVSPVSDSSKNWQPVDGGGFKTVDPQTGYTSQISADGSTIESKKQVAGQWVVTKLEATNVQGDAGQEKAILYTRTGPISTDAGQAVASVASVYTPSDQKFSQEVVSVTDAVSSTGARSAVTDSTALSPSSGGGGSPISSQFNGQGSAAGSGALGVAGVGKGSSEPAGAGMECGIPGKPACVFDMPVGPAYTVPQSGTAEISAITDGLTTSGVNSIKAIETVGDKNGLLTWAMLPLPSTASCVDPLFSFDNRTIQFSGFCDKMTLLRVASEYILYLVTLMFCFKLVTESQREV